MPDEPPEQNEPAAQPEASNDPAPVPTPSPAPVRPVNAAEADVGGPATVRPQKRGRAHLED